MRFGFGFGFGSQLIERGALMGTLRNFTTLASAGSKYYTIPSISLTGDFEISCKCVLSTDSIQMLLGSGTDHYISVQSGLWRTNIGNANLSFGDATADMDGRLHKVKFTRVGSTTELFIDEISKGTQTQVNDFTINQIGFVSSWYWDNIIADLKIYDDGTLVLDMPLDETLEDSLVIANKATTLGAELVTNGDFSSAGVGNAVGFNPDAALANVDNQLVIAADGNAYGTGGWENLGAEGDTILIEADIIATTGNVRAIDISNNDAYTIVAGTRFSQVITLGSLNKTFGFGGNNDAGFSVTVDNVSIKQADYYGMAVNITTADSETFTKSGDDWLGIDIWTNPPDDVGSDWVDDGGGQYTLTGTGGFNALGMNTGLVTGQSIKVFFNMVSQSANMKIQSTSTSVTIDSIGIQSKIILLDGALLRFARVIGNTNCVLKDVLYKRILEAP